MISWLSFDDDETRGIKIMKKEANGAFSLDRDGNQVLDAETTDQVKSALPRVPGLSGNILPGKFHVHSCQRVHILQLGDGQDQVHIQA